MQLSSFPICYGEVFISLQEYIVALLMNTIHCFDFPSGSLEKSCLLALLPLQDFISLFVLYICVFVYFISIYVFRKEKDYESGIIGIGFDSSLTTTQNKCHS